MAAKMLTTVVFAFTVMTSSAVYALSPSEIGPCPYTTGVPFFKLNFVCDKSFYGAFISEDSQKISCALGHISCALNGTITMNIKVFENGVKKTDESPDLVDLGNGAIQRTLQTDAGPVVLQIIVTSYREYQPGDIKIAYVVCSKTSGNPGHNRVAFIATGKEGADFTDDIKYFNREHIAHNNLFSIPNYGNECNVNDYYQ